MENALLGCTKTRTAPYHPESDGMIERFNRTCLMMLSMFVNDRRDNWHKLLPFVMHAYCTSVHESTGYSPFRLMMGEECSLRMYLRLNSEPVVNRTFHLICSLLGFGMPWRSHMTMFEYHFIGWWPTGNGCMTLKL